jgi:Na+/H+ antiporter NhaD/arsenite permease-like protein
MQPYGVILLLLALPYISVSLDLTGIFAAMAMFAAKNSGGSGKLLFVNLYLLNSLVTIVASNDVVVLTLTPIVIYFSEILQLNPLPYLFAGFHAANTASTLLLIGNATNIIVGESMGIGFILYVAWMCIPTIGASISSFLVLYFVFRNDIPTSIEVPHSLAMPLSLIKNKKNAFFCTGIMLACLLTLFLSSVGLFWKLPIWVITLSFAAVLLVRDFSLDMLHYFQTFRANDSELIVVIAVTTNESTERLPETQEQELELESTSKKVFFPHMRSVFSRVPFSIVPFVLGMFIMVAALSKTGWVSILAYSLSVVGQTTFGSAVGIGLVSSIACVLLNNQPMSILFSKALLHPAFSVPESSRLVGSFAVIAGSNLGGNLMIQAALAGFMWIQVLEQKNIKINWQTFAYYGFIGATIPILVATTVLGIEASLIQ